MTHQITHQARLILCLAAALSAAGCSTKPRNFSAAVRPSASSSADRDQAEIFATCDRLVRRGHKSGFVAAAATGAAGGAGALGGAVAGVGVTGSFSTAGSGVLVTMPVVGIAAAFGVNRLIRSGRERKYKRTMSDCMAEFNYEVVNWTKTKKKQPGTATLVDAKPAEPSPVQAALAAIEPAGPAPQPTGADPR